ncbi:hypothetical protein GCM10011344_10550 [Dokdonia pacifica]|uniref:DUF4258 domain-containing protein n=1 Tax=Dokdonia pacifica TaxID=1627892 RepID=A0A238YK23_9FLAO|nr:DUF4258 domain-containing protein [Dokdonia pacifica]GGG11710.1 hypothetical protein GCM10011344_10550 [Dokdonia pacifica]SNR71525.1 hypothetical protein SAMN06265376_102140 [Dokdonia pacifica]
MRLLHRIGYYLGGFSLGLIVLAFFFSGKKTSCAYFPQARVSKNINTKMYTLSRKAHQSLSQLKLDTIAVNDVLQKGEVDFGESQPRKEPCSEYSIYGKTQKEQDLKLILINCEEIVQVLDVHLVK